MKVEQLQAHVQDAEGGERLAVLGGLYIYRAIGADNGNAFTLFEVQGRTGLATPHHLHEHEEEGFYVVAGAVALTVAEETRSLSAGAFGFVPRGVPHAFSFTSPEAKLLLLITPGAAGHESLFREIGKPWHGSELPPPPSTPPDFGRMAEIAARNGTRIVGPPPM
jgi:quercetin dioxygenase-like cupin family protein